MIRPLTIAIVLAVATTVVAAGDKPLASYNTVVLQPFTLSPELKNAGFPAEYQNVLEKTLFARLLSERVFETVSDASLDPAAVEVKSPRTLIASGEVVGFNKGNRAARIIINYGAGSARLKLAMVFRDSTTGQEVLRLEQEGSYAGFGNLTGGSAETARIESARKVVDGLMKKIKAAK